MLGVVDPLAQRFHGVVGEDGDRFGRDHRARVDTIVDEVDRGGSRGRTGREDVLQRMGAREVGERRGMDVDDTLREALEEGRPQQVHVPGTDDELHPVLCQPVGHREIARIAIVELLELEARRRHSGRGCAGERAGTGSVGCDGDDLVIGRIVAA